MFAFCSSGSVVVLSVEFLLDEIIMDVIFALMVLLVELLLDEIIIDVCLLQ